MIQQDVYKLINNILKKHKVNLQLREYVDLNFQKDNIIGWGRTDFRKLLPTDKISTYLKENFFKPTITKDKIFYHYLPKVEYLEEILINNQIRLNNLNKYLDDGDDSEYYYFLDSFGIEFPKYEAQISSIKDRVFIWCLTNKRNSKKHWEEYAAKGDGIAISIEIIESNFKSGIIEMIPVCYNLDFLKEIQDEFKKEYNLNLEITSYSLFAKFFKKEKYQWESEIRLCFDKAMNHVHDIGLKSFKHIENDKEERDEFFTQKSKDFIFVPLKNSFFEIKVKEIFCNKKQKEKIERLVKNRNISIIEKD
jgi:hypothetical protein